jgi:hypothetical protein
MDDRQFDSLTRAQSERLSRRGLGQFDARTLAALGLAPVATRDAGAKKKKR